MKFQMVMILSIFLGAVSFGQSPALTPDGNGLLQACGTEKIRTDAEKFNYGYCAGVVDAVSRMMQLHSSPKNWKAPLAVCYPKGVTQDQLERVVVKYLQDHPEALHMMNVALVEAALNHAFPCQPNAPPKQGRN
jgi:hypothetical protein